MIDSETFDSSDEEILTKDFGHVQSEAAAGSADVSSALSARERKSLSAYGAGADEMSALPAIAHFAGRNSQVNTRIIKHSAIITSAQKKEIKSL